MDSNHLTTKFSVIIPIYNTAQYLHRCIDSIITQGYENLEVILVDDGSTDNSPAICTEYAQKDQRIKVIHKQNGGQSAARNDGIAVANGDYILFVDSDDFLQPDTFTTFNKAIQDYPDLDIISSKYRRIENNKYKYIRFLPQNTPITGYDFLKIQKKKGTINISPCIYTVNRLFILHHSLLFKPGFLQEDTLWTYQILLAAKKVIALDFVHYNYVIRKGSSTQSNQEIFIAECLMKISFLLEPEFERIEDNELKTMMMDYLVHLFFKCYLKLRSSNNWNEYSHLFNKKMIMNRATSFKNKGKVLIYSISPSFYYYYKTSEKKITYLVKKLFSCFSEKNA